MSGRVVVDIGNTRMKWGRAEGADVVEVAALPLADADAWQRQCEAWQASPTDRWTISGVQPARRDEFVAWLRSHHRDARLLASYRDLPLQAVVDAPERVGIDRLLNAVAANQRRAPNVPAIIVDAGSAVTVDYVDHNGVFRGGAIFPGLRLMARALHDYTALLPIVEVQGPAAPPGASTERAIAVGLYYTVLGGIERLVRELQRVAGAAAEVYLTGGDAPLLAADYGGPFTLWPEMTLTGILASDSVRGSS